MPSHYKKKKEEEDEEPPMDKMAKVRAAKKSKPKAKAKSSPKDLANMSDAEYYKEHKKHHSAKHIKAMKELQKIGADREKAHKWVAKNIGN